MKKQELIQENKRLEEENKKLKNEINSLKDENLSLASTVTILDLIIDESCNPLN